MGSMTLDLEGWHKSQATASPEPVQHIQFHIGDERRLELERAENELQKNHQAEMFLPGDVRSLKVETSEDCGPLADCQLRVYRDPSDDRCHFHLVGHRASDHHIVYSNSVLVDHLL